MANLRIEESPLARHVLGEHVMSKFVMSARQASELDYALERNGWSSQEVKLLSSGNLLTRVLEVVRGSAIITTGKYTIDCDAAPFVSDGCKIEEHRKGGQFNFDASQIELYLSAAQKKGRVRPYIRGDKLRKELARKPVLNANVLDFLLAHQELIPEDWKEKDKRVFFWGTIYRDSNGCPFVRSLWWRHCWWGCSDTFLAYEWFDFDHAALRIG